MDNEFDNISMSLDDAYEEMDDMVNVGEPTLAVEVSHAS